ncbi:PfkB domain protein [Caldicellulosiruptor hydrothermalis 108]|uniref:PfkB domain protein n=1 Tax=Caldicellulosiruptor hydrothermalis (strain DSM 18901 / VKM B-2411 / 108) TaxID=632292 RepID=E4QDC5_CALH1|nr:carbohydrate kinase [Caldicellulosiruptor hydrothermalis]ADQ06420.1 PfkB domain protein [Caldicellulosiruptor hydrothermalis 108]
MSIVCFGEALIDFLNVEGNLFEANIGGGPTNVAGAIAKWGGKTFLISKVGNDMFGRMIKNKLEEIGVDVSGLKITDQYFTTLAFVKVDERGERSFSFSRKHGADVYITPDEIEEEIIKSSKILHFSSLSMTHNTNRKTTFHILEIAKNNGLLISYDPNFREPLWESKNLAIDTIMLPIKLGYVDILKVSLEEVNLYALYPEDFYQMIKDKVKLLFVTMGEKGTIVFCGGNKERVPSIEVTAVDTTGCGDCFMALILFEIWKIGTLKDISFGKLIEITRKANVAGALCATKKGALPAVPDYNEIERVLSKPNTNFER